MFVTHVASRKVNGDRSDDRAVACSRFSARSLDLLFKEWDVSRTRVKQVESFVPIHPIGLLEIHHKRPFTHAALVVYTMSVYLFIY